MRIIHDDSLFSERGYIAPTVYLLANKQIGSWNYYRTREEAYSKYLYLNQQGGSNVAPAGSHSFNNSGQPQTFGINVDFYAVFANYWSPLTYKYFKNNYSALADRVIFRFYTTEGNGPFWAIYNRSYFGISATVVNNISNEKLQALDNWQREVQLLKYRYNAFAAFLNDLSKKQLSPKEQQVFNQGVIVLQNFRSQLTSLQGIEITFNASGQASVGVPVFLLIGIIAILAGATAWTVSAIISEKEKTARINQSYQLNQWVAAKKQEIATQVSNGTISAGEASSIYATLDKATNVANNVAEQSSKPGSSIFGDAAQLLKWGVIGIIAFTGYKLLTDKKQQQ